MALPSVGGIGAPVGRRHCVKAGRAGLTIAVVVVAFLAAAGPVSAQTLPPNLDFDVIRDNDVIGHHQITFRRQGDEVLAHSAVAIKVDVAFVTVFRYEQIRDEVWKGGKLIAFTAKTNDDGTNYDVKGQAEPDGSLKVRSVSGSWTVPASERPAAYWNLGIMSGSRPLVNIDAGKPVDIKLVKLGPDTVEIDGKRVAATHFRIEAPHMRDLWYDSSGRWIKMTAVGKDNSVATWTLK